MKIILFLLVIVALGAGLGYFFWWRPRQLKDDAPKPPTATVERGPIKLSAISTGKVVSNLDVDIKCKAGGTILNLPFDVSNSVKAGELLCELDPVDERRNVDLAQVQVNSSKARLVQARQNLVIAEKKLVTDKMRADANLMSSQAHLDRAKIKAARLKMALDALAATQEDYDTAETDAVSAAADLEVAKAQVEELKTEEAALELKRQDVVLSEQDVGSKQYALDDANQRLKDIKVMAPMDGVVAARSVQIGQIIASAISNVGGGTTILTLSDLSRIFILASVDESEMAKVKVDQDVDITADAFPQRHFHGKVARIATRGTNVSNVVTFEVKIEILDDKKSMLKPEMTANVEIIAQQKDNVLLVPVESVVRKKGNKRFANISKPDGTTEERPVEVGVNDGNNVEILSGLSEGEVVALRKGGDSSGGQRPPGGGPPGGFGGGGGGGRR